MAWFVAVLVSALVIICPIVLLGWVLSGGPAPLIGIPDILYVAMGVLLIASTLGLTLPVFAVLAWGRGYWSVGRRLYFSLVALTAAGMVPYLDYWNLLGFRF